MLEAFSVVGWLLVGPPMPQPPPADPLPNAMVEEAAAEVADDLRFFDRDTRKGIADLGRWCERVRCTQAQLGEVKKLARRLAETTRMDRTRLNDLRGQIGSELEKGTPDRMRLDPLWRELGEVESRIATARYATLMEIHAALGPEQRVRMAALFAGKPMPKPPRGGGHGHHGHGRRGGG